MLLTGFNLAHYLLDKGRITPDCLLDGTFTAHSMASRNANFLVNRDTETALFVKQVQVFDPEKTATLRTEATCYWLANNEAAYAQLKTFLPRYISFDAPNHILITEAVQGSISLNAFYVQHRQFPVAIATLQAELLSSFHKTISIAAQNGPSFRLFKKQLPTVFVWSAAGFPSYNGQRSEAERQMVHLITQNSEYMQKIAAVRDQWQTTSLIHGDIKPDNFLINNDAFSTQRCNLRLIDWETADIGDPCWDAAAVWQSYLFYWVFSEPPGHQPATGEELAFSLEAIQPAMRQFWQTYARLMEWPDDEIRANLHKTIGYCALKLIHTCYESIAGAPALTSRTARLLQLSLNLLRNPNQAVEAVFGL